MMSGHGGKRKGAGRPSGAPNKATAEQKATLSELAKVHAATALEALVNIAAGGQSESARVAAACALLDRAFGRPGPGLDPSAPVAEDKMDVFLRDIRRQGSRAPIATEGER